MGSNRRTIAASGVSISAASLRGSDAGDDDDNVDDGDNTCMRRERVSSLESLSSRLGVITSLPSG